MNLWRDWIAPIKKEQDGWNDSGSGSGLGSRIRLKIRHATGRPMEARPDPHHELPDLRPRSVPRSSRGPRRAPAWCVPGFSGGRWPARIRGVDRGASRPKPAWFQAHTSPAPGAAQLKAAALRGWWRCLRCAPLVVRAACCDLVFPWRVLCSTRGRCIQLGASWFVSGQLVGCAGGARRAARTAVAVRGGPRRCAALA